MNICVVSPSYPTHKTIVFVFVDQLCKAFASQGEKVTIIAPQSVSRSIIHHEPLVPTYSILTTSDENQIGLYRPYFFSFGNGRFRKFTNLCFNHAVKRAYNKLSTKPDIFYGHFWSSIFAAFKVAKSQNIPLFGASGEECVAMYADYNDKEKLELSNYISGLVNVSTKNLEECISLNLISLNKSKVIPNAVNLDTFKIRNKKTCRSALGIKDNDFVISFVGQFVPRKGTNRICEALNKIGDCNIKAIFIGSGVEDPQYEGIVFKGRVNHDEIADYLYASDIYVMPTENEGCSNAIIEAMACGLPIISTDAPFNYDILNENNSILVDCHNIDQIAEAIKTLRDDKSLREKLSKGAQETAKGLSIEERAKKILTYIKSKLQ